MSLFWCLFISIIGCTVQEKVKVSVYYETFCPGSKDFITTQLYPTYQLLGDNPFTLELLPFVTKVKINKNNKYRLTCQHGKDECYVNKVHACVINANATQEAKMNFVQCSLESDNPENKANIKKCLRTNKLIWSDIKECLDNDGTQYLIDIHKKGYNLQPHIDHVPHILFNDIVNKDDEVKSRTNFLSVFCSKLHDEIPPECTNHQDDQDD